VFQPDQELPVNNRQVQAASSKTTQQSQVKTPAAKAAPLPLSPELLRQVSGGTSTNAPNANW
jgi:hypothetical protein